MPFDVAMRKFSKLVDEAGILQKVREKEYYEKPTAKRKRKKKEALKRQNRLNAENPINQRNNRKY
jgi:small subunit ribosomal protein S21|tara:strand:+ start:1023 stop:1217 length:195 start_codon:yes stop_codon:yes gene_type:complete